MWRSPRIRSLASAALIGAAFVDSFFVTCTVMDDAMAPTVGVDTKVAKVDDNVSGNGANKHATPAQTVARIEESHHLAARSPVIVLASTVSFRNAESDDLVVMRNPLDRNEKLLRRYISSEYEWVRVDRWRAMPVPQGHCWVQQDNPRSRMAFEDSRTFGAVPMRVLEGKALAVVWPPKHWKLL